MRGDEKGERDGEGERPALQRRRQDDLDDVGGVGAEHHHLAMRHVDHAHDAEGDGEADRGEQQHRRSREAVPEILRRAPDHELGVDRGQSRVGGGLDLRIGRLLVELSRCRFCASWSPRALSVSIAESRSAEVAWSLVATIAATASFSAPATRGSLSLASWAFSAGSALASRVRNTSPAAASRFSGSGLASVSEPVAPSMAMRIALLTRTFLKASALATGAPVLASTTDPSAVR